MGFNSILLITLEATSQLYFSLNLKLDKKTNFFIIFHICVINGFKSIVHTIFEVSLLARIKFYFLKTLL